MFADAGAPVSWRCYRDGGWLAKAVAGRKTLAWLAVEEDLVRITLSFAERHRPALAAAPSLPAEVRERVADTALIGRLLRVPLEVRSSADVALVSAVLAIKLAAT